MEIDQLLQICVERNASDIHITVGKPPTLRVDGILDPLDYSALQPDDTEKLIKSVTSESHLQKVQKFGGVDFGLTFLYAWSYEFIEARSPRTARLRIAGCYTPSAESARVQPRAWLQPMHCGHHRTAPIRPNRHRHTGITEYEGLKVQLPKLPALPSDTEHYQTQMAVVLDRLQQNQP